MNLKPISQVIITSDFKNSIEEIKSILPSNSSIELFIKEESTFLVSDANEVIAKAYLASKEKVFLILATPIFSEVVQNRLLKIIEEPPPNKEFILITSSSSSLLPTITSRLPLIHLDKKDNTLLLELDIKSLNLQKVYSFIKENRYIKQKELSLLIEEIIKKAIYCDRFELDEKSFKLFKDLKIALNLGSSSEFILTTLLLHLLQKVKK